MLSFKQLRKNCKGQEVPSGAPRMALVGDTATQFLATALRGEAIARGYDINLFEAEYNQVERQFLDPSSELYSFDADYIVFNLMLIFLLSFSLLINWVSIIVCWVRRNKGSWLQSVLILLLPFARILNWQERNSFA